MPKHKWTRGRLIKRSAVSKTQVNMCSGQQEVLTLSIYRFHAKCRCEFRRQRRVTLTSNGDAFRTCGLILKLSVRLWECIAPLLEKWQKVRGKYLRGWLVHVGTRNIAAKWQTTMFYKKIYSILANSIAVIFCYSDRKYF